MAHSKRTALVIDAIRLAVDSLAVLPDSEDARELRASCCALRSAVEAWNVAPPSAEEREQTMRKVVALHVAVTKLRRRVP